LALAAWCIAARGQNIASVEAPDGEIGAHARKTSVVEPQGTVLGVVTSTEGEQYEGAVVRLDLKESGKTLTERTNSSGAFTFADVPAGDFQLAVSSEGFNTQIIQGVVHLGESFDAHTIVLPMAAASAFVQVTASDADIAVEQYHLEVHQRVLGMVPNFYVTYVPDAPPLTAREKYSMALRWSADPFTLLSTGALAGIQQAKGSFSGYGQGAQGYAKRFGANYADGFINNLLGGAVLPALFKQDPRYFYKGTGTKRSRVLYAIANSVVCRGDNGRVQFDYSGILGSLASGGISNLYYPAANRNGIGLTVEGTGLGILGSAVGNLFQEFVARRFTPNVPDYTSSVH
jgi:hypothetical protein